MSSYRVAPFILVKPDGARYLTEIDNALSEMGMHIERVYFVSDWERTARALYAPQFQTGSRELVVGLEAHFWLNRHLFGNHSLILELKAKIDGLDRLAKMARKARDYFRNKIPHSRDGTFIIALNLDRLVGEPYIGAGVKGKIGIQSENGSFTPLTSNFLGRWDDYHFKHIHAPDDEYALVREWHILMNMGVISRENLIDYQEWNLLKRICCLTPPSKASQINSQLD